MVFMSKYESDFLSSAGAKAKGRIIDYDGLEIYGIQNY